MQAAPALSIVLPVLNEASRILAALEALAPLRAGGAEVIVVDGGSTDRSVELARSRADRVLAAPRGRASQMKNTPSRGNSPANITNRQPMVAPRWSRIGRPDRVWSTSVVASAGGVASPRADDASPRQATCRMVIHSGG